MSMGKLSEPRAGVRGELSCVSLSLSLFLLLSLSLSYNYNGEVSFLALL